MSEPIFANHAPAYWAAELPVIPLRERNKMPAINQWSTFGTRMPDQIEMNHWLASFPKGNIGLPLGTASGMCMIDIDTEDEELIAAILDVLPASPWKRVGKKGMALAYQFEAQKNFKLRGADGGMLLEFLGQGNQVVLPPSIHPETGLAYTSNTNLWEVKDQLPLLGEDIEDKLGALLGVVKAPSRRRQAALATDCRTNRFDWWLRSKLTERVGKVSATKEGDRNNCLFVHAAGMANDVSAAEAEWAPYAAALAAAAEKVDLDADEIEATLNSAWSRGSESPTEWITIAKEWIYVAGSDQFRHLQSDATLKRPAFRTRYAYLNPAKKMAFDTFLTNFKLVDLVQEITYSPSKPRGVFKRDGLLWYNDYRASTVVAVDGDASPFEEYLSYLVPDPAEREHLLKMMAHLVRHPGEKLAHALILGSRTHGVGKSTLISILEQLMGPSNCCKATSDELAGQYQGYLDGKLLVTIEELDLGSGFKTYHKLKDLITAEVSPMRKLYENSRNVPNNATFVFLTNLDVPLMIEPSDRRFMVIMSPAKTRDQEYWTTFNRWWRASLGIIRHFLDQVDLSEFERFTPPPMTGAKERLIARSASPTTQDLAEMIEARESPFTVDVLSRNMIHDALKRRNPRVGRGDVERALADVGAENLGQHRIPKGAGLAGLAAATAEKPTLWAVRNMLYWQHAPGHRRVEEFLATSTTLPVHDGMGIKPLTLLDRGGASVSEPGRPH